MQPVSPHSYIDPAVTIKINVLLILTTGTLRAANLQQRSLK
jgi:hypothetical protein